MSSDINESVQKAIDIVDTLKSNVCEIGKSNTEDISIYAKQIRQTKMGLINLKSLSRQMFGGLHSITKKIENEMKSSDTLLIDLNRIESEINSIKRTIANYNNPEFVEVENSAGKVELTKEDGDKKIFTKRCEFLDKELEDRKRLRTELNDLAATKTKQMNDATSLKLHIQNTIAQQLDKVENSIKKATDYFVQDIENDEE